MDTKKRHPNQYKDPHFTCVIHYGKNSDKYIREWLRRIAESFGPMLDNLSREELILLREKLEEYRLSLEQNRNDD